MPLCFARHAPRCGAFGKIAGSGDFVRVGGDAALARLDVWLDAAVARGLEVDGAAWAEGFARAPAVAFVEIGGWAARRGVVGVVVPSADAVGRAFPLVIAAAAALRDLRAAPHLAPVVCAAFVQAALGAAQRATASSPAQLGAILAEVPSPAVQAERGIAIAPAVCAPFWQVLRIEWLLRDPAPVALRARSTSLLWTLDAHFAAAHRRPLDPRALAAAWGTR